MSHNTDGNRSGKKHAGKKKNIFNRVSCINPGPESDQSNSDEEGDINTCNTDGLRNSEVFDAGYKRKKTDDQLTTSTTSLEPDQSTSSEKLNIITWNIGGSSDKLEIIQNKLTSKENIRITPHVVFLQETRCVKFPEKITQEWHVFYTQYMSTKKGVAILVNKSKCKKFQLYSEEVDSNGRYVVVKCSLGSRQKYTLVCVYNHQSDITTLDLLTPYLKICTVGTLVIGGDFNTTFGTNDRARGQPNGELEHYESENTQHDKIRKCVERFMRNLQLFDVYRKKKADDSFDETCFTFRKIPKDNTKHTTLSRLDYFFIPEEKMCSVTRCEVLPKISKGKKSEWFTDHSPLLLELENKLTEIPDIQTLQIVDNPDIPPQQHQNIPLHINGVEIVAAIQSLSLEENEKFKHSLSSLITDYNSSSGTISEGPQNRSFSMTYLVLSSILARRLQDWCNREAVEDQDEHDAEDVQWPVIQRIIRDELKDHPCIDDFNIIQNMLSSETAGKFTLYNGCPLSCTLRKLFT